jgi:hypothetical protein
MRKDDENNVIDQANTNQALPIERRAGNFPARFALKNLWNQKVSYI